MAESVNSLEASQRGLLKMVNGTPLGKVIGERGLRRLIETAGTAVMAPASPTRIHIPSLGRWLGRRWLNRHPVPKTPPSAMKVSVTSGLPEMPASALLSAGEAHSQLMATRSRKAKEAVRDIAHELPGGRLPDPVDPKRREACEHDLERYIHEYGPKLSPMSAAHKRVIANAQLVIEQGGDMLELVFRGFGKTTLASVILTWPLNYGLKKCVIYVADQMESACDGISRIKQIYDDGGSAMAQDFPEICFPIIALENITTRCRAQTYLGERTKPEWHTKHICLPTIAGSRASGARIMAASLSHARRGLNLWVKDPETGRKIVLRPDLVLVDDPQKEKSARSKPQTDAREEAFRNALGGSSGHMGNAMSRFTMATPVCDGDLVSRFRDRDRFPSLTIIEEPFMLKESKARESHWFGAYAERRNNYDRSDRADLERARRYATEYYLANRAVMDAGAEVTWEHAFKEAEGEVSAIQHYYNLLIDKGPDYVASELQMTPTPPAEEAEQLSEAELVERMNGIPLGVVPDWATQLLMFVDMQERLLYWVVKAVDEKHTSAVVDWGTFPEQPNWLIHAQRASVTLRMLYKNAGQEGAWHAGLDQLTAWAIGNGWRDAPKSQAIYKHGRTWTRQCGEPINISRIGMDANGRARDLVFAFAKDAGWGDLVIPVQGKGITADSRPMAEWAPVERARGERSHLNWRYEYPQKAQGARREVKRLLADTNFWKSHARDRLRTPVGDSGAATINGPRGARLSPKHQLLVRHFLGEYSRPTTGRGRTVEVWKRRPNEEEHFWDGFVETEVMASAFANCALVLPRAATDISRPRAAKATGGWSMANDNDLAAMAGKRRR